VWNRDGSLFKVAQITWDKRDASLYVILYPTKETAYVGVAELEQSRWTFDARAIGHRGTHPYVSIHENGHVHAHVDDGDSAYRFF
jgi:hypothetical protein